MCVCVCVCIRNSYSWNNQRTYSTPFVGLRGPDRFFFNLGTVVGACIWSHQCHCRCRLLTYLYRYCCGHRRRRRRRRLIYSTHINIFIVIIVVTNRRKSQNNRSGVTILGFPCTSFNQDLTHLLVMVRVATRVSIFHGA